MVLCCFGCYLVDYSKLRVFFCRFCFISFLFYIHGFESDGVNRSLEATISSIGWYWIYSVLFKSDKVLLLRKLVFRSCMFLCLLSYLFHMIFLLVRVLDIVIRNKFSNRENVF